MTINDTICTLEITLSGDMFLTVERGNYERTEKITSLTPAKQIAYRLNELGANEFYTINASAGLIKSIVAVLELGYTVKAITCEYYTLELAHSFNDECGICGAECNPNACAYCLYSSGSEFCKCNTPASETKAI